MKSESDTGMPRSASAPTQPHTQSDVALRAFFGIAAAWNLNTEEQMTLLGQPARSTFFKWKKEGGQLSKDTLDRISYLLGIFRALEILFPDADVADAWARKPNSASIFNGQSALDRMLAGGMSDLFVVRSYLDAQRGG